MSPVAARAASRPAAAAPAPAPTPAGQRATRPRPELRVVPALVRRPPLAPFLLVSVGLAIAGLVALLLLNTLVAQDSFRVDVLQKQTKALSEREQLLKAEVADREAPGALADRARGLGMGPAGSLAFLDLEHRREIGRPEPAPAPAPTRPPKPSAVATPSKAATSPAKPVTGRPPKAAPEVAKTAKRSNRPVRTAKVAKRDHRPVRTARTTG